jgi:hypothetical protein
LTEAGVFGGSIAEERFWDVFVFCGSMLSFGVDSGAEKDVIRDASSYLDFLIVQYYSASTNLFTFSEDFNSTYINEVCGVSK